MLGDWVTSLKIRILLTNHVSKLDFSIKFTTLTEPIVMKSIKDLFIKSEEEEKEEEQSNVPPVSQPTGFPVNTGNTPLSNPQTTSLPSSSGNPYLDEIAQVYEKGLDSINMPGYDFYDFFSAIKAAGAQNEAIYKMAFQMGKTMDSSLTAQKLVADADFYLSKIRDVHQKYSDQGRQKLDSLVSQQRTERENLSNEANQIEIEISKLKQKIQDLEGKLAGTRGTLSKVDDKFKPQQDVVQQKLAANDQALQISSQRLSAVKDAILLYLK